MPVIALLGAQWGDEGKGKIAARLCQLSEGAIACRYSGGPNAGHQVFHEGESLVFRILPAAALHASETVLGAGLHIRLDLLLEEVLTLERIRPGWLESLHISDRAHLIRPEHVDE